jgi:hypothetical protein
LLGSLGLVCCVLYFPVPLPNPLSYNTIQAVHQRFALTQRKTVTILSYIGTYYAIASAFFLTVLNYFLIGWFNGYLDHYYVDSFKIYFSIVIVFQALGVVSLAVLRYRVEGRNLFFCFLDNLKWLPLLTIFLGGLSIHVFQAIVCHMLSIDMSWGATAKEATRTSFFAEIPTILKKFKFTFIFCFTMVSTLLPNDPQHQC